MEGEDTLDKGKLADGPVSFPDDTNILPKSEPLLPNTPSDIDCFSDMNTAEMFDHFEVDEAIIKEIGSISKFKVLESALDHLESIKLTKDSKIASEVKNEVSRLRGRLRERRQALRKRLKA